jgi:hypothetical protein
VGVIDEYISTGKLNYTTINHTARELLGLTPLEYCVLDSIRVLGSINPESQGWCYASKQYLANFLKVSESFVFKTIKKAEQQELVERRTVTNENHTQTGYTRTTRKFNETVMMKSVTPYVQCTGGVCTKYRV